MILKILLAVVFGFIVWFSLKTYLHLQKIKKYRKIHENDFDLMRSNVCQICGKILDEETFRRSEIFCSKCRKENSLAYLESCRTLWRNRQMKRKEGRGTWKDVYQSNPEWRKYYAEELKRYNRLSPLARQIKIDALRDYMEEHPDDPPYRDLMDAIQRRSNKE